MEIEGKERGEKRKNRLKYRRRRRRKKSRRRRRIENRTGKEGKKKVK